MPLPEVPIAKKKYARSRRCLFFLLSLAILLISPSSFAADVIVHPSVSEKELARYVVRAVFGMRVLKWPNGVPIRVFVLDDTTALHIEFAKEVLDVYPYQLRQAWDRLIYSGTGQAPTQVSSEAEMVNRVATTPGAIGYVKNGKASEDVRILLVR